MQDVEALASDREVGGVVHAGVVVPVYGREIDPGPAHGARDLSRRLRYELAVAAPAPGVPVPPFGLCNARMETARTAPALTTTATHLIKPDKIESIIKPDYAILLQKMLQ